MILLNWRAVYHWFISFVFPHQENPFLLKRIIKTYEQYFHVVKLKLQLFSFGSVINDQGVLANLESLTCKYVRTDLNAIPKIFFLEK